MAYFHVPTLNEIGTGVYLRNIVDKTEKYRNLQIDRQIDRDVKQRVQTTTIL